ncbi:hypothetical protein [Lysobacter enzymogenes]|uniref:hypothetical protein n=1 Tax=Lysobacter enzymogenes TaxID=69 RepID=UPI001AFA022D|nr:hypothetical protein [Lysobacter enzymogenes]QQQ01927.1 hypothetical protein JHW41_02745 [Lysobacter enzymogenes]
MAVFRLPIRLIRERFGGDNFDDAGDWVDDWLRDRGERRYRIEYSFDAEHVNPWFHAMVMQIDGLSDAVGEALRRGLVEEGLSD